ncbi:MAG: BTAD domain-containing putative transcriptional regulator [Actinomycetota bacterium]
MDGALEFCVLGPLRVHRHGAEHVIAGRRERTLLAALLLTPGEPTEVERLAQLMWPATKPRDVPHALRTHIMRLRRHVGRDRIETSPGAYALRLERAAVDAHRFDDTVATATAHLVARQLEQAEAMLAAALEIWPHGAPYIDLAGTDIGEAERARLTEERSEVEERLAAVQLAMHLSPLVDIERLALECPLRENRWLLLMYALSISGQQARALRSYATIRTRLRQELGLNPDRRLQDLEHRILEQDPQLPELDPLSFVLA